MQPRKSSALSSLPDAVAPPLDLTDLAICLKYLILWCNHLSHAFSMHLNQNLQRMCQTYLRLISFKTTDGCCVTYLPIPLNPLISFSFLQASATETSSSWSLGWKITHFFQWEQQRWLFSFWRTYVDASYHMSRWSRSLWTSSMSLWKRNTFKHVQII